MNASSPSTDDVDCIVCNDHHIGVGTEQPGGPFILLSANFSFKISRDASQEEIAKMMKWLCDGMMDKITEAAAPPPPPPF